MPEARLWEVVAVSLNIEPGVSWAGLRLGTGQQDYKRRLRLSEVNLGGKLPVRVWPGKVNNHEPAYAVVGLKEFASFAKDMTWPLPPRFPVDPVNWEKWERMDAAPLWQAILLSLGRSPDVAFEDLAEAIRDPYASVRSVAISSLGRGLRRHLLPDRDDLLAVFSPEERTEVLLIEFREWAEKKGYTLPDRFPRKMVTKQTESATEAKPASTSLTETKPRSGDGVTVLLPHTNPDLEAVFKVMREFWTDYDEQSPPKQTAIARRLDDELGWSHDKNGGPSRSAQQVASMLRPSKLSEADKRSSGRRSRKS